MKTKPLQCIVLSALLLGNGIASVSAQSVPALINYQGQLANPDGTSLPTGDYTLEFRIYDAATGGNLVWGPQTFNGQSGLGFGPKIPVVQGYFNVMLGPSDQNGSSLTNAFVSATRYLQVTVGSNSPILPRQQFLSAPFALRATTADFAISGSAALTSAAATNALTLAGYDWSAILANGATNPVIGKIDGAKILTNSIPADRIVAGGILSSLIAPGAIGAQQIAANAISTANLAPNSVTWDKLFVRSTNAVAGNVAVSASVLDETVSTV